MALKMFWSLNLQTSKDVKQWDVVRKQGLRGYQEKMPSARKEYVSMDRTEICDVANWTIDDV